MQIEEQAVRPWWSLHRRRGSAGVGGWPDEGDPVRDLDCTAEGVPVGGLGRLHGAGRVRRGCMTARSGLVVGECPPPGVGCVGVGGQEVVPAEEEEAAAF